MSRNYALINLFYLPPYCSGMLRQTSLIERKAKRQPPPLDIHFAPHYLLSARRLFTIS